MNEFIGKGESGVRAMRDLVFGVPTTDGNWEACKEHWLRPESIIWLVEKVEIDRKKAKAMAEL